MVGGGGASAGASGAAATAASCLSSSCSMPLAPTSDLKNMPVAMRMCGGRARALGAGLRAASGGTAGGGVAGAARGADGSVDRRLGTGGARGAVWGWAGLGGFVGVRVSSAGLMRGKC